MYIQYILSIVYIYHEFVPLNVCMYVCMYLC